MFLFFHYVPREAVNFFVSPDQDREPVMFIQYCPIGRAFREPVWRAAGAISAPGRKPPELPKLKRTQEILSEEQL